MDTKRQLKKQVLKVLEGARAGRIRFSFPVGDRLLTIGRQAFLSVAQAIRKDKITIYEAPYGQNGSSARYMYYNEIQISQIVNSMDESDAVHESLHAYFDLKKIAIPAIEEEAAAYVVSTMYLIMAKIPQKQWNIEPHATAGLLSHLVMAEQKAHPKKTPVVNQDAWDNLLWILKKDPIYDKVKSYTHDG
ncbi:MAG: hypothetical protein FD175_2492 [Beijerinckiaceae bacterium]|nr:MAG: hypothetical protein FD175_2492 [Beijerinckiaceae bacterium]